MLIALARRRRKSPLPTTRLWLSRALRVLSSRPLANGSGVQTKSAGAVRRQRGHRLLYGAAAGCVCVWLKQTWAASTASFSRAGTTAKHTRAHATCATPKDPTVRACVTSHRVYSNHPPNVPRNPSPVIRTAAPVARRPLRRNCGISNPSGASHGAGSALQAAARVRTKPNTLV